MRLMWKCRCEWTVFRTYTNRLFWCMTLNDGNTGPQRRTSGDFSLSTREAACSCRSFPVGCGTHSGKDGAAGDLAGGAWNARAGAVIVWPGHVFMLLADEPRVAAKRAWHPADI